MSLFKRIFGGRGSGMSAPVRWPGDPNELIVDDIHRDYPFGMEGFGLRSFIRLTVYVVLEMKKRGLI